MTVWACWSRRLFPKGSANIIEGSKKRKGQFTFELQNLPPVFATSRSAIKALCGLTELILPHTRRPRDGQAGLWLGTKDIFVLNQRRLASIALLSWSSTKEFTSKQPWDCSSYLSKFLVVKYFSTVTQEDRTKLVEKTCKVSWTRLEVLWCLPEFTVDHYKIWFLRLECFSIFCFVLFC